MSFSGISAATFSIGGAAYVLLDADLNPVLDAGGNPIWIIEV